MTAIFTRPLLTTAFIIQGVVLSYIAYKLIGVVRTTYRFGSLKAVLTVFMAGIAHSFFGYFIVSPIWTEVVKQNVRP